MPVKRWIYGIDLQVRWDANQAELVHFVYSSGLNIYQPETQELIPVAKMKEAYAKWTNESVNERRCRKGEELMEELRHMLYEGIFEALFDMDEVIKFEQEHGLLKKQGEVKQGHNSSNTAEGRINEAPQRNDGPSDKRIDLSFTPAQEQGDPEGFIRSLSISYENDTEIKIKTGGQRTTTYSHKELGFGGENTKAWRAFIGILQSSDHLYHLGVAHGAGKARNRSYDANRGILRGISKKLVSFLNRTYMQQLPANFQIFELAKDEPPGTYMLKCTVSGVNTEGARYNDYSKENLIAEIEKLSSRKARLEEMGDKDSENIFMRIMADLEATIAIAIEKGWLDRNRAESYLCPKRETIFPQFEDVYEEEKPVRNDY